jgi:pyruvate kinase
MMSLVVRSKTADSVKCEVVDGGELKSRRHLNVRGKSATLPSITGNFLELLLLNIFSLYYIASY